MSNMVATSQPQVDTECLKWGYSDWSSDFYFEILKLIFEWLENS